MKREARKRGKGGADEMVTTTIALDAATHYKLRRLALDKSTSLRELIREAIAAYLKGRA
jgi:predicted transcriptional regulator